ncbi:hypothetical protein PR202_gb07879 [Eleusine coracana subsp. coracana]|uniref:Secreted protein n=1 Tax=Eleusine coracana subsp. coracana TaxID=191504 RepID=A0AAV5EDB4_ELECO|nr:hypothetical protein PR202_gb07879 [Eleusine coracana subsp. coracana]
MCSLLRLSVIGWVVRSTGRWRDRTRRRDRLRSCYGLWCRSTGWVAPTRQPHLRMPSERSVSSSSRPILSVRPGCFNC